MSKVFVPPIKCQGIKTKLVHWIIDNIDFNESSRWVEPFMGSGVVGFNVRAKNALFCEINPHIINFYNALKESVIDPDSVKTFLESEGRLLEQQGEDYYYLVRNRFNKSGNPLDFIFLSRACFNGLIRFNKKKGYNVPFGHKPERFSQAYITKITNQVRYVYNAIKLNNWNFRCQDFRETISNLTDKDFIYCDPPYAGRHVDYFNSWSDKDDDDLYRFLSETKAKFILSTWYGSRYRNNKLINKYWSKFHILTREHFYHVGAKEENRNPMIEALVLNYNPECLQKESLKYSNHIEEHKQMSFFEEPALTI